MKQFARKEATDFFDNQLLGHNNQVFSLHCLAHCITYCWLGRNAVIHIANTHVFSISAENPKLMYSNELQKTLDPSFTPKLLTADACQ